MKFLLVFPKVLSIFGRVNKKGSANPNFSIKGQNQKKIVMLIQEYPLTDMFYIILFEGRGGTIYNIRDGNSMVEDYKWGCNGFSNRRDITLQEKELMGRVVGLTEKKAIDIFERARIDDKYINYLEEGEHLKTAKESLISYIELQGWEGNIEETHIIVPKKSKKLKGTKIPIKFNVGVIDFGYGENTTELLDVFMTPINEEVKDIKFAVKIPERIYNMAMTNTNIEKRPKRDYIESSALSTLHSEISQMVHDCHLIWQLEKSAEKSKKVIVINFASSEMAQRDDYNHAYIGQQISTKFNFFVAQLCTDESWNNRKMFCFKELFSGSGSLDKGRKGIVDYEKIGKRRWIENSRCDVVLDWSQEKEDFLTKLEEQFRQLSVNLNEFLKDLNEEKLLALIKNNKLGNSNMKLLS